MSTLYNFDPDDKTPTAVDRVLRRPTTFLTIAVVATVALAAVAGVVWTLWSEGIKNLLASQFAFAIIMMALSFVLVISVCGIATLAERKIAAFAQDRKGPNRVGFWGLIQPLADGLKFLLKEDITPARVEKPVFYLAPVIAFVLAYIGFAVIPWAGQIQWPWMAEGSVTTQVASIDMGILYILAVGGLAVYGVVLAGWASNNKYSFFGGMRAAAQMVSYEVPLGLALLVILLTAGTLRLELIVDQQATSGVWNVFMHPLAFVLTLVVAFAETNRTPFDLAECEQELVGGFHTEYSSMKFAMFFLAEYAHMVTGSAVIVALFLGGWHFWGLPGVENHTWWAALIKFAVYWAKVIGLLFFFMWIRWTLPRFRFDQLMRLAWKGMIPVGMGLLLATGVLAALGWQEKFIPSVIADGIVLALTLAVAARARTPVSGRQDNLPPIEVLPGHVSRPPADNEVLRHA